MVQATSQSPLSGEPTRPQGVGLTAIALGALIVIYLIQGSLRFFGGALAPRPIAEQLFLCCAHGIELLFIWHYWKGQNWGRIFVLLWSLLVAVQAVAFLADHNLDPTALMSRPVSFLHALLAIFLLYWLNTPALRAWFKKISSTEADLIAGRLVGKLCTALDFHPTATNSHPAWRLTFEHGAELTLSCPWRIVLDDNLAFVYGSTSSTQAPALVPDPSSDPADARRLLQNLRVTAVRLAPHTSDLFLTFEMGIQLQTWTPAPAPAPTAGSAHAPAVGREPLPHEPALPHAPTPQWTYSDPLLTVIAGADGLSSEIASPSPPADEPADA